MAEIHVMPKKRTTPVWIWLILAAVIVAVVVYFAVRNKKSANTSTSNKPNQTSYIQHAGERAVLS
jgi:hypothetical protein